MSAPAIAFALALGGCATVADVVLGEPKLDPSTDCATFYAQIDPRLPEAGLADINARVARCKAALAQPR